ncbi:hypothetical protein FACS1894166_08020 [Bacilli bacterium]|nr:hypothetical protein FACS1894166_08020 [Bacilli bacterium]
MYSGVTYVDFSILHKQNLLKIFNITNTNLFLEQTNPSAQDIVNNLTQHGMYSSI